MNIAWNMDMDMDMDMGMDMDMDMDTRMDMCMGMVMCFEVNWSYGGSSASARAEAGRKSAAVVRAYTFPQMQHHTTCALHSLHPRVLPAISAPGGPGSKQPAVGCCEVGVI